MDVQLCLPAQLLLCCLSGSPDSLCVPPSSGGQLVGHLLPTCLLKSLHGHHQTLGLSFCLLSDSKLQASSQDMPELNALLHAALQGRTGITISLTLAKGMVRTADASLYLTPAQRSKLQVPPPLFQHNRITAVCCSRATTRIAV